MTPSLLENVQVYLLAQDLTRYCRIYLSNSSKFKNKLYIKKADVENLKIFFHFMDYHITF